MTPHFLPAHFQRRSEFYLRLGQFVGAGLSVSQALADLEQTPPSAAWRSAAAQLGADLARGGTLAEAFRRQPALGELDAALVEAGERAGRLAPTFQHLAEYYRERGEMAARFLHQTTYPLFVLHFAWLVFAILLPWAQSQFQASLPLLVARALLLLLPLYGLAAALIWALQGSRGQRWRHGLAAVLDRLPLLGPARRSLTLSRLAFALQALVAAGLAFPESWRLAAAASRSPRLERLALAWAPQLAAGRRPSDLLRAEPLFQGFFAHLYATGESTGTLENSLRQIAEHYRHEGLHRLAQFTSWVPRLLYLGVAAIVGWRVIAFYRGYVQSIDQLFRP